MIELYGSAPDVFTGTDSTTAMSFYRMGTGTLTYVNPMISQGGYVIGSFDTGTLSAPDISATTIQVGGEATLKLTDGTGISTAPAHILTNSNLYGAGTLSISPSALEERFGHGLYATALGNTIVAQQAWRDDPAQLAAAAAPHWSSPAEQRGQCRRSRSGARAAGRP